MKKTILAKELFIETMEALEKQALHDEKCVGAMEVVFDGYCGYDNHWVTNQLIKLAQVAMGDKDSWIEYWIYELDFGKNYKEGCVMDKGEFVPLETSEDLYNMLVK
jgi:hypothetical protein